MSISASTRVGMCGALGGAVNAWLCYARLPVAVNDNPHFEWHVIPAGGFHGGLLAVLAYGLGHALAKRRLRVRLASALPLAWVAGFVSWIPLDRSTFDEPWSKSLVWPLHEAWGYMMLGPLQYFGLVALLYYAAVAFGLAKERRLGPHVAYASAAGILGSLWWWVGIEPWYFSILHGAIWGTLVGVGAWSAEGRSQKAGDG